MNVKTQGRTAYQGAERGSIVQFTELGVHMRLAGTGEVVFLVYRHLDPIGFKKPKAARSKKTNR